MLHSVSPSRKCKGWPLERGLGQILTFFFFIVSVKVPSQTWISKMGFVAICNCKRLGCYRRWRDAESSVSPHTGVGFSLTRRDCPMEAGTGKRREVPGSLLASFDNREYKTASFFSLSLILVQWTTQQDSYLTCSVHVPSFGPISVDKDGALWKTSLVKCVCAQVWPGGMVSVGDIASQPKKEGGGVIRGSWKGCRASQSSVETVDLHCMWCL